MAVVAVIGRIPVGTVLTYGEVAAEAGRPGAARAVGNLLRTTAVELPWWRVVGSGGTLLSPDPADQADRLRAEAWRLIGGRLVR